jgi:hypothetical protein
MKKQLISMSTTSVVQGIALILVIFAAVLAVSAVVAQPYGKSSQSTKGCTDWPLPKDRAKVEKAFDKVLNDSATDSGLRNRLLDSSDCYKNPKAAVQDTLDHMSGDKVTIPPGVLIIFYENDTPDFTKPHPPFVDYPSDHCLHIFFLPDPTRQPATKTSFRENLMCCYKPWEPPPPP